MNLHLVSVFVDPLIRKYSVHSKTSSISAPPLYTAQHTTWRKRWDLEAIWKRSTETHKSTRTPHCEAVIHPQRFEQLSHGNPAPHYNLKRKTVAHCKTQAEKWSHATKLARKIGSTLHVPAEPINRKTWGPKIRDGNVREQMRESRAGKRKISIPSHIFLMPIGHCSG